MEDNPTLDDIADVVKVMKKGLPPDSNAMIDIDTGKRLNSLIDNNTLAGDEFESIDRVVNTVSWWRRIIRRIVQLFEREDIYGVNREDMPVTINLILCDNCKQPLTLTPPVPIKLEIYNPIIDEPDILKYQFCTMLCLREWMLNDGFILDNRLFGEI